MTRRPLLELVPRWAGPGQCVAEVSPENLVGMDDGSIPLENANVLYLDHVQIATANPTTNSSFAISRRYILFPSKRDHSIPISRPFVQRFSAIRF